MSELVLKSGVGKGDTAKIGTDNRLQVRAIQEAIASQRSFDGAGYNLNTGVISLTTGAESAVMYFKYTGSKKFHVTRLVYAFGALGGTVTKQIEMVIKQNPTTGTIIDDETAIDINSNRDFASPNEISGLVYKGTQGKTFTDGTDALLFFGSDSSRSITPVDIIMSKGNSIGLTAKLNATSGGDLYAAIVGYETEDV